MKRSSFSLIALASLACVVGCTSPIQTAQLKIVDTGSEAGFDGNDQIVDGRADSALGLTIVEGRAAVIEVNVGDGDPTSAEYEGEGDTFARSEGNIIIYPITDDGDEQRRFMLTTTREGGVFKVRGEFMVSSSSYDGELRVPVRIVRQDSYDDVASLPLWPYETALGQGR